MCRSSNWNMTNFPSPNAPYFEEDNNKDMALCGKINDELLICKICYMRFSTSDKLPKLLSCSHTFCEPCLRQHVEKLNILQQNRHNMESVSKSIYVIKSVELISKQLICPLCRKKTDLIDGKIENLANNYTILSLLEILENQAESVISQPKSSCALTNIWDKNKKRSGFSKLYPSIPESNSESKNVSERCIMCNKRYPESQYKCGHCICYPCSNSSKVLFDGINCPKCSTETTSFNEPELTHTNHIIENTIERPPPFNPIYFGEKISRCSSEILTRSHNSNEILPDHKFNESNNNDQSSNTVLVQCDQRNPKNISNSVLHKMKSFRGAHHTDLSLTNFPFNSRIHLNKYSSQPSSPLFQSSRKKHFRSLSNGVQISSEPGSCYQLNSRPFYENIQGNFVPPIPPRRHSSSSFSNAQSADQRFMTSPPRFTTDNLLNSSDNRMFENRIIQCGARPPVPPQRFIQTSQQTINCLIRFGKYSEISMQTSTFSDPNRVSVSMKGDVAVTDLQHMTVQVFKRNGIYVSMFKVVGVQGVSFISNDKLAVASHRGVTIFTIAGEIIKELTSGLIINTAAYKFGLVACSPVGIFMYKQSFTLCKEITKRKSERMKFFRKSASLQNIKDIAITVEKNIAILDSLKGVVFVINDSGYNIMTVNPADEPCGILRDPESLSIDRSNNIYISDTGNKRILRFTNKGVFSKCILNFKRTSFPEVFPRGIDVMDDNLVVILSGEQAAEIHIYQIP